MKITSMPCNFIDNVRKNMNKMFTSLLNETSNFDNQLRVSVLPVLKSKEKSQIEGLGFLFPFFHNITMQYDDTGQYRFCLWFKVFPV